MQTLFLRLSTTIATHLSDLGRLIPALLLAVLVTPALGSTGKGEVAWRAAANDADISRAFAVAKTESKPVLLYWGASWCPPCNKLKATLFNRQDFITQSTSFVAVNIDGDLPSAQKLGTRFKVSGYPTMILFNNNGVELTRLPGEVEPEQIMAALNFAMAGGRSAETLLADMRAGKTLSAKEWRTLAFYSWETGDSQIVSPDQLPQLYSDMAAASVAAEPDVAERLWLKAVAASDGKKEVKGVVIDDARRERFFTLVRDPAQFRRQTDVLVFGARELASAMTQANTEARTNLLIAYDSALARLQNDPALARADRLSCLAARIELARIDQAETAMTPSIPPALQQEVRDVIGQFDKDITNGYERQAVIPEAAFVLGRAGLWQASDDLLKANLAKSISPYYLMSSLGSNARKQGRNEEALEWYGKAWAQSKGPATRLQWGSSYINVLVDLAPNDDQKITATASKIFAEAEQDRGAFHQRSARSLKRIAEKLALWNTADAHQADVAKLTKQLEAICKKLPETDPQRKNCNEVVVAARKT